MDTVSLYQRPAFDFGEFQRTPPDRLGRFGGIQQEKRNLILDMI